jgi:hypothetical protein
VRSRATPIVKSPNARAPEFTEATHDLNGDNTNAA